RDEMKEAERRLEKRADNLDKKLDTLSAKERMLEQGAQRVRDREAAMARAEAELNETLEQQRNQLLKISGLSMNDARNILLTKIQHEVEHVADERVEKMLSEARETAEEKSREIIITAMQRYANGHTSASTVSTVDIQSDDMKGRVIGREGRNIRAFE